MPLEGGVSSGSWLGWHRLLETSCPLCKAWPAGTSDVPPSSFFLTHIFTRHMPNATCSARHPHACSFRYNLHPGTEVKTTSSSSMKNEDNGGSRVQQTCPKTKAGESQHCGAKSSSFQVLQQVLGATWTRKDMDLCL